jgi:DNA-binding CsgD family transcriptional regulator
MSPSPEHDHDDDAAVGLDSPLLAAFHDLPVPMWTADRLGYIRWLNRSARTLLGLTTGSHFSRYVAAEDVADAREMFARKVQGVQDAAIQQTMLLTSLGPRRVEVAAVAIREGEEVVGVLSLIRGELPATVRRRPKPRLTPRQNQVLQLLAKGLTTAEIAERLGIAEETTRNHIRLLMLELRVRTRLEAVVIAFRNDWL